MHGMGKICIASYVTETRGIILFCDTREDPRKKELQVGFEGLQGVFSVHNLNNYRFKQHKTMTQMP